MFIKQNVLERLLKEAYKGSGLHIAHTISDTDEPIYVIASGRWVIWVGKEWLTKEAKAAIIKLCGDLPSIGEGYRAVKDYDNQYEIESKYDAALAGYGKCGQEVRKTKLSINSGISVLQSPTGEIYYIDKRILDMVDYSSIDTEEGEREPVGPYLSEDKRALYWRNNVCTVMICLMEIPETELEFWNQVKRLIVI